MGKANLFLFCCGLFLAGCASSSVMDLDSSTVQISTRAAEVCGPQGAQRVATRQAALETLKHGFDRYIVTAAKANSDSRFAGFTPLVANTYGSGSISGYGNYATVNGYSNTTFTGGQPIIVQHHNQDLIVRMFKADDPVGANAIDARSTLGPDWQKQLAKGPGVTCN